MLERDGYPAGVPCWVDVIQPDLDATMAFYGGLFGWSFEVRTPEGAPSGTRTPASTGSSSPASAAPRHRRRRPMAGPPTSGSTRPTTPSPR